MKHKILIVEDNLVNMDIFNEIFEDDYELKTALNGLEALEVINEFNPDLILLDVMMPNMDGYEVCKRIRAQENYKDVKIVMVSARAMKSEREKGIASGADFYVTKPFDEDELLDIVTKQLA